MENQTLKMEELKDTVQDCNINFLIGSGISRPFLGTLGKIEILLTEIDKRDDINEDKKKIVRASLYKNFFDTAINGNIEILNFNGDCDENVCSSVKSKLENEEEPTEEEKLCCTLSSYRNFLKIINSILLNRKSTILSKQVNVFTTNVDIFLEKALENSNVEYNDGFSGRFKPSFNLGNFKKSYFKKSLHYDNTSELPVFNLMKAHGSVTWKKQLDKEEILFSPNLDEISAVKQKEISEGKLIEIGDDPDIEALISSAESIEIDDSVHDFLNEYEKLSIVNPTKEKFKDTVLNQTYYEILRIFLNEMEKENTILFVMGFSFADEHIRKIIIRAANSNPTLKIYIFAYTDNTKAAINSEIEKSNPNNKNIKIISPKDIEVEDEEVSAEMKLDLQTLNEVVFEKLLEMIDRKEFQKKKEETKERN